MKKKYLTPFILCLLIILGLLSKGYSGFGANWINNYSGDIIYEVFWCLFFFWLFPSRRNLILIPVLVFIITSIIEITQLWQLPLLQLIRSTIIGKFLLGTTFSWWDFPHYLLGCFVGLLLLYYLDQKA